MPVQFLEIMRFTCFFKRKYHMVLSHINGQNHLNMIPMLFIKKDLLTDLYMNIIHLDMKVVFVKITRKTSLKPIKTFLQIYNLFLKKRRYVEIKFYICLSITNQIITIQTIKLSQCNKTYARRHVQNDVPIIKSLYYKFFTNFILHTNTEQYFI